MTLDDGRTTVAPQGARLADDSGRLAAKIVVVSGPDEGREVAIEGAVEVGSGEGCALLLRDPAVSRRHLEVSARGNAVPDLHLAALLRQHDVKVLYSADADFRRFAFLEVRNPFDVVKGRR